MTEACTRLLGLFWQDFANWMAFLTPTTQQRGTHSSLCDTNTGEVSSGKIFMGGCPSKWQQLYKVELRLHVLQVLTGSSNNLEDRNGSINLQPVTNNRVGPGKHKSYIRIKNGKNFITVNSICGSTDIT